MAKFRLAAARLHRRLTAMPRHASLRPMSYVVTLQHIRYGRLKLDLAELKRRIEFRIAAGSQAPRLAPLLVRTRRVMTLIDDLDHAHKRWDGRRALDAELALLLLDMELVQAVLSGRAAPRIGARRPRALPSPRPKRRPTR